MVVRLFAVVSARRKPSGAVVTRRVPHEPVLQRLVALLVPLEVANHLFLLDEDARVAVEAVEVLAVAQLATLTGAAVTGIRVPSETEGVRELRSQVLSRLTS